MVFYKHRFFHAHIYIYFLSSISLLSVFFRWIQLSTGAYCPKHHQKAFLKCHRLQMALNYRRATLFSILSTMSISQPLSPAVWTSLVRAGITRVQPTHRGSRAGRLRRTIATYTRIKFKGTITISIAEFCLQNLTCLHYNFLLIRSL